MLLKNPTWLCPRHWPLCPGEGGPNTRATRGLAICNGRRPMPTACAHTSLASRPASPHRSAPPPCSFHAPDLLPAAHLSGQMPSMPTMSCTTGHFCWWMRRSVARSECSTYKAGQQGHGW